MANEREFQQNGSMSRFFYGIDTDGKLFRKATQADIDKGVGIKEHVKQKGANAGQVETRKIVASIYGYPTAVWIKSTELLGDFLIFELYENGQTSVLQMQLESSFADDLMRKLPNLKAGTKYEVSSWKMQATDQKTGKAIPDKFIRGISVKDSVGNKIERYITKEVQEKILPISKVPLYEPDATTQTKAFWQIYFKLLLDEFKKRVITTAHKLFDDWFEQNRGEQETAQNEQVITHEINDPFPTVNDIPPTSDEDDDLPF